MNEEVKKQILSQLNSDIFVSEAKIREAINNIETNTIGIKNHQSHIAFEREKIVYLEKMKKVLD